MIDDIDFIEGKIAQLECFKEYFAKDPDELNIVGMPKKESVDDLLDMYRRILALLEREKENQLL